MKPIIQSLLDADFYKFTMAQIAFRYFRHIPVKYAFKNRTTTVDLTESVSEEQLRAELDYVLNLRFTEDEIAFLRESKYIPRGTFKEDFLYFLRGLKLPPCDLIKKDKTLRIEVSDFWPEAIFWETMIMGIVNELHYRSIIKKSGLAEKEIRSEGDKRLEDKIRLLQENPGIKFVDFGTRRRFSYEWQEHVLDAMIKEVPDQLLGTSNVHLAKRYNLRLVGTMAHEMFMIFSGIFHGSDEEIRASHNNVVRMWWEEYGEPYSIALSDTYGSDFFFSDFTKEQAGQWRGTRQDSGDPFAYGEKTISFYKRMGIDPKTKTIVFSDGLTPDKIVELYNCFHGRINVLFGWGTNLMNDLGFKPLSIIVKAVEACGHELVKLSDNLAKSIGGEQAERFKRIFGYTGNSYEECKY